MSGCCNCIQIGSASSNCIKFGFGNGSLNALNYWNTFGENSIKAELTHSSWHSTSSPFDTCFGMSQPDVNLVIASQNTTPKWCTSASVSITSGNFLLQIWPYEYFWRTYLLFVGPLIPLFWNSGDVCPGFQSQGGSLVCVLFCLQTPTGLSAYTCPQTLVELYENL